MHELTIRFRTTDEQIEYLGEKVLELMRQNHSLNDRITELESND